MKFQPFAAALLLLDAINTPSAHAQLGVEWITQYGTSVTDFGSALTVDALGQSWVSGVTSGNLGGANAGSTDSFLSRLSASGGVDFTRQRGGTSDDSSVGVALVGSGTVFAWGYTSSSTIDSQPTLGGSDGLTLRYDSSGIWQGTTRFGSGSNDYVEGLAGNATHLLAAGYTFGGFDGQTNQGTIDAFLSKHDSTGAVVWTRFAGTSDFDQAYGAAFDSAGNSYLAGYTSGSFSGFTNAGDFDLFLARYDADGSQTLFRQLGTGTGDFAYNVKVDVSGNIYLTGTTTGNLGGQSNQGASDAFVMKLDSNGNVIWTRLLGGAANDDSVGLALDSTGHVWIGGYSESNFAGHTNAGERDAFVAEYDSDGLLLETLFLSTASDDIIKGLAIGSDGAVYVAGYTYGSLGGPNAGDGDVFVAKIVPEPASALLLGGAGLGLLLRRRRA